MTELVARLRAKQVMLEKLALLLIEHRILKASDLTGITSECREAADAIESQERDKTALAARIAELERDNKNVREELQRRDKIYQSGTVVVTNDKYSELVQRAEKAESALSEYNKLRESTYAYYLQAERELAAANARADAVSDALDYLKGLTPQKYADLRKDAERYRWLRVPGHNLPISHEAANVSAEAYDAAIDAAIAAKEKP